MIVTRSRPASVSNPDRYAPPNLQWSRQLDGSRPHYVDLITPTGRRFARLCGDDRAELARRAKQWRSHIASNLEIRWPEP